MRKRLDEIAAFETVLCMVVVIIHILSAAIGGYARGSVLSAAAFLISRSLTFAVPAFIASSGIKMFNKFKSEELDYPKFIIGRIRKIFVPYVLCGTAYYLYFVFRRHYFPFDIKELLLYLVRGDIAAPFYFIIVIMQFYILMPLWLWTSRKLPHGMYILAAVIITVLLTLLTNGYAINDRLFTNYLIFWVCGCVIGLDYDKFMRYLHKRRSIYTFCGIFFTALYAVMAYLEFLGLFHSIATEMVKLVFSAAAAFMYLSYMPNGGSGGSASKYLNAAARHIAPASFYVYLIHCLILFEVEYVMTRLGIASVSVRLLIQLCTTLPLSILLSVLYVRIKAARRR